MEERELAASLQEKAARHPYLQVDYHGEAWTDAVQPIIHP